MISSIDNYTRRFKLIKVIDGDTYQVNIDLGFNVWVKKTVRLLGVDCAELHSKDEKQKQLAIDAKEKVIKWFESNIDNLHLRTYLAPTKLASIDPLDKVSFFYKEDSFGRVLADVCNGQYEDLATYLLVHNLAVPYKAK